MTGWIGFMLPLAITTAWLWLPGLIIGAGLRLRPLPAVAFAPLVSVGVIGLSGILAARLRLPWGPLPPLLLTAAIAVVVLAPRLVAARRRPAARLVEETAAPLSQRVMGALRSDDGIVLLAMALGAVLLGVRIARIIGHPDAISQTFDNVFHLSAVRWMLDHQNASSLTVGIMTSDPSEPAPFYPAIWHAIVSLVITSGGGASIPVATNALAIAASALVWTTGGVALAVAALPSHLHRIGILPAGALVAAVPMFPFIFLGFGVVYPNLLGFALLPAAILLVMQTLGAARDAPVLPAVIVIGGLGASALVLSHPNSGMALLAMTIPVSTVCAARAVLRCRAGEGTRARALVVPLLACAAIVVACVAWPVVRPEATALGWEPLGTLSNAIGEGLTLSPIYLRSAWSLALLLAVGAYAAMRHRRLEVLGIWTVGMLLWCAGGGWPVGEARTGLVGVWYNDPFRLAALLGVPVLPVLVLGTAHLLDAIRRVLPTAAQAHSATASAVATVLLAVATQLAPWMQHLQHATHATYAVSDESMLLTAGETALLEELPELVPADAVIATSPWDGSSLAYAYSGIRTTNTHPLRWISASDYVIDQHLDQAAEDPEVCRAVRERGVTHALSFTGRTVNDQGVPMDGLDQLGTHPGFTLIARHGDAALYRVDACRP